MALAGHGIVNEVGGQPGHIPPWSFRGRIRRPWVIAVIAVAIGVVLVLLFLPVSQSSSFQITRCLSWQEGSLLVPSGTILSFSWSFVSGAPTGIQIVQGGVLFNSTQASGNAIVDASGQGAVSISAMNVGSPCAPGATQVSVSWEAALLWPLVQPS